MPQFKQLTYIVKAFPFKRVNRLKNFSANIPIFIEKNNYIVKTADSPEELCEALRLRHDVFISELLKRKKKSGLDKDKFDKTCDHLIIIDKRINAIIGTYRLQSSLHTRKYYTATEFHMRQIKRLPGNKLELGRACVHPEHRNGVTISLLWEGITAYIAASDSNYLFGCSSIKTMDRNEISQIYYYLKQCGYIADEHLVRPKGKFKVPGFKRHVRLHPNQLELIEHKLMRDKIPSLLSSYLKVGAKVCGIPALDKSFRCIDFLTLMNVEDIKMAKRRKDKAE